MALSTAGTCYMLLCIYMPAVDKSLYDCRDRQPFAWAKHPDGVLNFTPAMLTIHRNFFFVRHRHYSSSQLGFQAWRMTD